MWNKAIKKTIFTLCVDNYAPEVTEITFPLIKGYADKIGADFHIIKERRWPDMPPVYEKLQIYYLGQEMENDWNIYIDADALIHPDLFDFTVVMPKHFVTHHGSDYAPVRWRYDRFFMRDGRHIGSGNWFTIASDLCIDLWHPLDDLTLDEALQNIFPTVGERLSNCFEPSHLVDDYTLSRNIAKYGLQFKSVRRMVEEIGRKEMQGYFWHHYTIPTEAKPAEMKRVLKEWRLT